MCNCRLYLILIVLLALAVTGNLVVSQDAIDNAADSVEDHKGEVTYVSGDVKKQPDAEAEWLLAPVHTPLAAGEKVRTLQDSRAELSLMEMDVIRIAPHTILDIRRLYTEVAGQLETDLLLEEGDLWADIESVDETEAKFNIGSRVAGAAITGTRFRLSVEPDSSTRLKVYHGEVHISNAPEKNIAPKTIDDFKPAKKRISGPRRVAGPKRITLEEWTYVIRNMQEIAISPRGEVTAVKRFSAEDAEEQSEWVRWNQERSGGLKRN